MSKIDFGNRIVFTSEGDLVFDYLIIALGASNFPDRSTGFQKAAYNFYDLSGTLRIREATKNFEKDKIVILISSKPFKCPVAPYEAALLLSAFFTRKRRDIKIEKAK